MRSSAGGLDATFDEPAEGREVLSVRGEREDCCAGILSLIYAEERARVDWRGKRLCYKERTKSDE